MTRRQHPAAHLASRAPGGIRATWCHTCRAAILTGLDNDQAAFQAFTDTQPLNGLGETLALLQGRATYEIRRNQPGRLWRRHPSDITKRPADTMTPRILGYDVVAAHRCGAILPDTCHTTSRLNPATREDANNAPF